MEKLNCWEFMRCGRELGGRRERQYGICPASAETRLEGVNGGICAGRACWAVAGTYCYGNASGSFAIKVRDCRECLFYEMVTTEEGDDFVPTVEILKTLGSETARPH